MDNPRARSHATNMGLRFLLAPEESSATPAGHFPPDNNTFLIKAKAVLWVIFSVLASLLIGQL